MSAITATASPSQAAATSMCRTRWAAKRSRSLPVPGHHPDRRRLINVEAASVERIAPFCPHFGVCGGCAIQHWDAGPYRAWKRELVVTTLAQAGIDCDVAPLVDAHGAGRRRITLHARMGTHDVLKVGYAAAGSHDIIPIDRCPILDPHLNGAIEAAWAIAEPLISMGKPLDIQVTATNSGLDVDVRGSGPLSTALITQAVAHRGTASAGAADAPRRTGADANAAGHLHGRRTGSAAARLVPAGNGGRRGNVGRAGHPSIASAANTSPTCSAASAPSRCGLRRSRVSPPSTATPARSQPCRRLRLRPRD